MAKIIELRTENNQAGTALALEIQEALCSDYEATMTGGQPNPQTKAEYAREKIRNFIRLQLRAYREKQASNQVNDNDPISIVNWS